MLILIRPAPKGHRDRIYIIKDIIRTLSERGELNQTTLLSYCGLNLTKHRDILENLESLDMVQKENKVGRKRSIAIFKTTQKGVDFYKSILDPYEVLFPRKHLQETR